MTRQQQVKGWSTAVVVKAGKIVMVPCPIGRCNGFARMGSRRAIPS